MKTEPMEKYLVLPEALEEPLLFQFVDITIVVVGSRRCFFGGIWVERLKCNQLLNQSRLRLRGNAAVFLKNIDGESIALLQQLGVRYFCVFRQRFHAEFLVFENPLDSFESSFDKALHNFRIFFSIAASGRD